MKSDVPDFSLQDVLDGTHGEVLLKKHEHFYGVATDSRQKNEQRVFFALQGENFDAHQFLDAAVQSGATALVVHKKPEQLESLGVTVIQVENTLMALQRFSQYWRKKLGTKIVAITGSNGKTTTKEFTATILSTKLKTHYSKGSFNNHFGLPLSLLQLRPQHDVAVMEMGMNHPGEIKELVRVADPDVVVVTTVGRAHLEGLGSLEAVAAAKEEIYLAARPNATRIYNLDNAFTHAMLARAPKSARTFTFSGLNPKADVHLKEMVSKLDFMIVNGVIAGEPGQVQIPVFGRQNITNLMTAACLALACDIEPDLIWKGLSQCKTIWGRNQVYKLNDGARVIFDGYNANPDSMLALIENFSRLSVNGQKVAIIGEMLEMGAHAGDVHEEIGRKIGSGSFDVVWFLGSQGEFFQRGIRSSDFSKKLIISDGYEESIAREILSMLQPNDVVMMKGSRGMKLEKIMLLWDPEHFTAKA
ncbi:MAG: UDP-N-acetylmuramoyl-tripeptide--D-alanyl-D-alanine ligase [Bdellovibrionales bacterium]